MQKVINGHAHCPAQLRFMDMLFLSSLHFYHPYLGATSRAGLAPTPVLQPRQTPETEMSDISVSTTALYEIQIFDKKNKCPQLVQKMN